MNIPVKVKSNISGRIKGGSLTPRQILDCIDEAEVIQTLTACDCQPIGETNVVECNCDEEWMDCEVWIGEEVIA